MLITRIITAVVLLAVLLPVLYFNHFTAFAVVATAFFGAAIWEGFRLFNQSSRNAAIIAAAWTALFAYSFFMVDETRPVFWFMLGTAIWLIRFVPSLKFGLPSIDAPGNMLLSMVYAVTILACFAAIVTLFKHSPLYLLSVMVLVWIADIGAYFAGKAFGKRKLAPGISPGKSWEGAIGGGIAVLLLSVLAIYFGGPALADTFTARMHGKLGLFPTLLVLVLVVAASIVGDLFESQLKRRAGVKDSSKLLPGHGGVLDRIDALVPVLPLAALIDHWL